MYVTTCMFDVVVHSRCRQMYVVQSLERRRRQGTWLVMVERTKWAVASTLPQKPDRPHTRASVSLRTAISEACSPTLSLLTEGGTGMGCVQHAWDCTSVLCCQPRSIFPSSYIYTRAEGGQRTITVAIKATVTASQKLTPSVTSVTSWQPL
jgi:hypothetical protein